MKDNIYSDETIKCHICGKEETLYWNLSTNKELVEHQMCFTCNHWRGHFERNLDKSVRVKNIHYMILPDEHNKRFSGFGGSLFKIRFHDGTIKETRNLWCQGHISEQWRNKLPDNAEFLPI